MKPLSLPSTRDLVLIGGGHTHALVLRKWAMAPLPGARVTVINPGPTAPYSGMLPGFLAGHYQRPDLDIDLVRLARAAGARIINGAASGLDRDTGTVTVKGRPGVAFDIASIDIGITSDLPDLDGFTRYATPAKPLGPFAEAWQRFRDRGGAARVVVIGAGVAGAEIALALAHALRARGRPHEVHLIDNGAALSALRAPTRHRLLAAMNDAGIVLQEDKVITRIEASGIVLGDGTTVEADFICGAAGARPHPWLQETGLRLRDGFVEVDAHLQTSDPRVFAAGDTAHMAHAPRPKAGVYAVRQAPILFDNLCARLSGKARLRAYRPQGDYLKLISMGGKTALGDRFGLTFSGPWIWRWKDRIDRNFMRKFQDLPRMAPQPLPKRRAADVDTVLGPKPMCGGCGSKLGQRALDAALAGAPARPRADIQHLPGDDAALLLTGTARQVISTDHLRALVEDPVTMARLAAVHALGDIWAMGAQPQAATATVILPRMSEPLGQRSLTEIMWAARATLQQAGAEIVGGHSSFGSELTIGFTITGLCERAPITLAGARPGDSLILTKPIGSGVLMAAEMAGEAPGAAVTDTLSRMIQPQADASALLAQAHAMTDVTGFGLAGHLRNICSMSNVGARVELAQVPLMPGALALSRAGIRSTLYPENRLVLPELAEDPHSALLFDPQTAGGLLAAVSGDAQALLSALTDAGYEAARIGTITDRPGQIEIC